MRKKLSWPHLYNFAKKKVELLASNLCSWTGRKGGSEAQGSAAQQIKQILCKGSLVFFGGGFPGIFEVFEVNKKWRLFFPPPSLPPLTLSLEGSCLGAFSFCSHFVINSDIFNYCSNSITARASLQQQHYCSNSITVLVYWPVLVYLPVLVYYVIDRWAKTLVRVSEGASLEVGRNVLNWIFEFDNNDIDFGRMVGNENRGLVAITVG